MPDVWSGNTKKGLFLPIEHGGNGGRSMRLEVWSRRQRDTTRDCVFYGWHASTGILVFQSWGSWGNCRMGHPQERLESKNQKDGAKSVQGPTWNGPNTVKEAFLAKTPKMPSIMARHHRMCCTQENVKRRRRRWGLVRMWAILLLVTFTLDSGDDTVGTWISCGLDDPSSTTTMVAGNRKVMMAAHSQRSGTHPGLRIFWVARLPVTQNVDNTGTLMVEKCIIAFGTTAFELTSFFGCCCWSVCARAWDDVVIFVRLIMPRGIRFQAMS